MQFVRKQDAERAIEKMQGFPIGGSRIRLSWGRSQCMFRYFFCLVLQSDPTSRQGSTSSGPGGSDSCNEELIPATCPGSWLVDTGPGDRNLAKAWDDLPDDLDALQ